MLYKYRLKSVFSCSRGTSQDNGRLGHHRQDGQLADAYLRHVARSAQSRHRQLVPGQHTRYDLDGIGERRRHGAKDRRRDRMERCPNLEVSDAIPKDRMYT